MCTRLGVLERVIARPKPKAGDIVYVLGAAQGVVYRERPANDRLEAFCEAFKNHGGAKKRILLARGQSEASLGQAARCARKRKP